MIGNITNFKINLLHNRRTINIPIRDNKLILVGENGTGKSTVSNLMYFFLTCQWSRMLAYNFLSVSAVIDEKEITIKRSDITGQSSKILSRYRHMDVPKNIFKRMENISGKYSLESIKNDPDLLVNEISESGIPSSAAFEYVFHLIDDDLPLPSQKFLEANKTISSSITSKVLYLPTYRRIEQDLKDIFPGYSLSSLKQASYSSNSIQISMFDLEGLSPNNIDNHIEMVKFGMEDVENMFDSVMNALKDTVRNDLNKLTGTYLRDVIQKAYKEPEIRKITELNNETIEAIFSRIDKSILSRPEQRTLRTIINKIKKDNVISEEDKVIVHFLTQLIDIYKIQQEREKDVRDFIDVCNNYLNGKSLIYDNINFHIYIKNEPIHTYAKPNNFIDLKMLSSGEKQIVSLFAHIYLSGGSGYFVIIDEPELSLSVPWQKRFLPNILDTGKCVGLIAVTHSPFIFDNKLDSYTHSLEEFVG